LAVIRFNIMGSPNIGIYSLATDAFAILPTRIPSRKIARVEKALNVTVLNLDLGYSRLVGVLVAANSNGMVLPHYISDEEVHFLKTKLNINVERVASNKTSFGNLVLTNDKGALAAPTLAQPEKRILRDALDVDVADGKLVGLPFVGSLADATNRGVLAHPQVSEDEMELLSSILKVPVVLGTVNGGVPYVSSGIIANSFGAVVGSATTGPELMMISSLFS